MVQPKDPYQPLNRLKVSGNLPVIPQILVQLIDACHKPEVDLQAVSKLVKKDAAMAAKVLQLCNSAFIGARSSFVDVGQAVIYLGADTVKNLAISVSVQQVFRRVETNGLLNIDRFWYHSYQNAILARRIAEAVSYPNPSAAYLAGLLHDLGKLLLWMAFPGKYVPLLLKGIRCHNGRLAFLEQEKLHINHCDAGAWLVKEWGLPSLIGDAIQYHHHSVDEVEQGLPLTRIIFLADLISHSDNPEQECNDVADQLFRLAPGQTEQLKEGVDEQVQEVAHQLGIRIPANSKSTLEPEPESEGVHKETSIELISRIRDITQLTGLLDNLLKAKDREQVAQILEQSLKILFNQETCFLLLFDRKNHQLKGFTSHENVLYRDTASLQFSLKRHHESLPVKALELHQILHSFMRRPDKDDTLLDTELTGILGT
ncbi:MAG TPA: HDOD domain-containing protein [Desulfobulbus sp.]|nr:HDOD domain-containing protein [Desulfobulbus sp.]